MQYKYVLQFIRLYNALYLTEDILSFIVKGHLYCEAALGEILRQDFKHPEMVDIDRLGFSTKVNLCTALGIVWLDLRPGLLKLNSLRNKIVHNLEYEIQERDQAELINEIKSSLGKSFGSFLPRGIKFPDGLRRCIILLWIPLQLMREHETQDFIENLIGIMHASSIIAGMNEDQFREQLFKQLKEFYSRA